MSDFMWEDTIKYNLLSLKLVGFWPKQPKYGLNLYSLYTLIMYVVYLLGYNFTQVYYIYFVYNDLKALADSIFVTATTCLAAVKALYLIRYMEMIKNMFGVLNSRRCRPKSPEQIKKIQPILRNYKILYYTFCGLVYSVTTTFFVWPFLMNYKSVGKLPFDTWFPFETKHSPNYEIGFCWQFFGIWYNCFSNLNFDSFVFAFMMFISAQCHILCDNLRNLSDGENFHLQLIECIKHHKVILQLAEDCHKFFSAITLGQMAISTSALALTMFELKEGVHVSLSSVILPGAYFFGISCEIFLYSFFGNEVIVESGEIPYALYESQWIGKSLKDLRTLRILSLRGQRSIKITAIGLFTLSLETYITIMKSAWSYFAVLSTVSD